MFWLHIFGLNLARLLIFKLLHNLLRILLYCVKMLFLWANCVQLFSKHQTTAFLEIATKKSGTPNIKDPISLFKDTQHPLLGSHKHAVSQSRRRAAACGDQRYFLKRRAASKAHSLWNWTRAGRTPSRREMRVCDLNIEHGPINYFRTYWDACCSLGLHEPCLARFNQAGSVYPLVVVPLGDKVSAEVKLGETKQKLCGQHLKLEHFISDVNPIQSNYKKRTTYVSCPLLKNCSSVLLN